MELGVKVLDLFLAEITLLIEVDEPLEKVKKKKLFKISLNLDCHNF